MIARGLLLLLCLLLSGCSERVDREASTPQGTRIVSLSPAATVMLRDMGLDGLVVGRHGWDRVADESLPIVGDQTGLDYERLLTAQPTHVVIEWGARDVPDRLTALSEDRRFDIVPFETLTLDDLSRSADTLGRVFASDADSSIAAGVVEAVAALDEPGTPSTDAGRVLLVVAVSPTVDCLGPGSAHHEILAAAGFRPAIDAGGPWMTLSLEDAIGIDPDTIVLVMPGAAGDAGSHIGPLEDAGITAIERGRVVLMNDPLGLIPSSNLVGFREHLIERLVALPPLPSPRDDEHDEADDGSEHNDRPG